MSCLAEWKNGRLASYKSDVRSQLQSLRGMVTTLNKPGAGKRWRPRSISRALGSVRFDAVGDDGPVLPAGEATDVVGKEMYSQDRGDALHSGPRAPHRGACFTARFAQSGRPEAVACRSDVSLRAPSKAGSCSSIRSRSGQGERAGAMLR